MTNKRLNLEKLPVQGRIIDITAPISTFTPVFPGDPKPAIEKTCAIEQEGCAVSRLILGSHTGTHVDAPAHVLKKGLPVDKLELERLMGRALILDFSSHGGLLTASILEKTFNEAWFVNKMSDNVSILLLKTSGTLSNPAGEYSDNCCLDESAAFWIVEKGFRTIGIDCFSVDSVHSKTLPVHHILLSGNVNIVECLELSSVDAGTYFFICLPLKVEGCDGAPARAILISDS